MLDELVRERLAEILAARALGGPAREVRIGEGPRKGILVRIAASRGHAAFVEAPGHSLGDQVADHIGRAGVERQHVLFPVRGDERQVGDPAKIQERDRRAIGEEHEVSEWDERRPFASRGDIGTAEVRDGYHARPEGYPRCVTQLERRLPREVCHRLTVHCDEIGSDLERGKERVGRVGVRVAERGVQ